MTPLILFLKRHSLIAGVVLMFLLTWPLDLSNAGVLPFRLPLAVYVLLGYGFVAASLIMTGITQGKVGVIALLKRYLIWRVHRKWYLVALLLVPAIDLAGIMLNALVSGTPPDFSAAVGYRIFGPSSNLVLLIVPYFIFDALTNGEEIGWRGYVLPRLQNRYSALTAALIIAILAGFWHFPKWIAHWDAAAFGWSMGDIATKSVLLAWMYNNTRGSLLLVTLFHASFNAAGMVLPMANTLDSSNLGALVCIVLLQLVVVVGVVLAAGPARLSRTERPQTEPPVGARVPIMPT